MNLAEFIKDVDAIDRPVDLWQSLKAFAKAKGAERLAYQYYGPDRDWSEAVAEMDDDAKNGLLGDVVHSASPTLHIVAHGFPDEWVQEYFDNKYYQINPIPEFGQSTTEPFTWSEAASLVELTEKQVDFMQARADAGMGDGIAVQVFGPNLRNGFVGYGFGGKPVDVTRLALREYQMAAQLSHLKLCKMIDEGGTVPKEHLSPREREVLIWIARGKSKSVIGDILGISSHTVDTNVRRIFRKLDVADRTSAALKGVASGIIPAGVVAVT